MPARLDTNYVKQQLRKYGLIVSDDFHHVNNREYIDVKDLNTKRGITRISYKILQNYINRGTIKPYKPSEPLNPFRNTYVSEEEYTPLSSFDRWLNKQSDEVKTLNETDQHITFNAYNTYIKQLKRKNGFVIDFNETISVNELRGFVEAAKTALPDILNFDVRLSFIDRDGKIEYRLLNPNTLMYLDSVFNMTDIDRIRDSNDDAIDDILNVETLCVEFVNRSNGKQILAGFYPFINVSDIDLRRYGIFSSVDDPEINDSCLLQAFRYSNTLTDDELSMLKSFIRTRMIPRKQLRDISDLLKIHINVKIWYEDTGKTSNTDFGIEFKDLRSINLIIINNHYMLNECTNVSECYVKRYNDINNDERFMNHQRKMMLLKFDDKRYSFSKRGLRITALLKLMIEFKLLIPMNDAQITTVDWSFKPKSMSYEGLCRRVRINDKRDTMFKRMNNVKQTKHFFGYKPDDEALPDGTSEVDDRIKEL